MRSISIIALAALALALPAISLAGSQPHVPSGFSIDTIAHVDGARELAVAPNGDLIVGTLGSDVYVVPDAEGSSPGAASVFLHLDDSYAAGVALQGDTLFIGAQFGVYRVGYHPGDRTARTAPQKIAAVRTSGISRDHVTTTVAVDGDTLYASVGSSCNACVPDLDATRATIARIDLRSGAMRLLAKRIRNAIALAINPRTHALWAGVAGADDLPLGHPYDIFDDVSAHAAPVDYGWPSCYENRKAFAKWPGDCSQTAIPRVVFPAYETPIGATFYDPPAGARYAFPAVYRGGAFVALHGSWHGPPQGLPGYIPPRVAFVAMHGDTPQTPVDWNAPTTQWRDFADGFQGNGTIQRIGRPTGVAVAPDGSLFVADDLSGAIYRIRPSR